MCKASTEIAGPKRCASHAREKLNKALVEQSQKEVKAAQSQVLYQEASKYRVNPFSGKNLQYYKVVKGAEELYGDNTQEKQVFLEKYQEALTVMANLPRKERDNHVKLGKFAEHASAVRAKCQGELFEAKTKTQEAQEEYWGTEEGLLSVLLSEENWEQGETLSPEEQEALRAFNRQSQRREALRRVKMESVRLHAKNTARDEDWAEYQKWQDAWNADPTLMSHDDNYVLQARTQNNITLRVPSRGMLLHLTRNPDTGRIQRKVDYRAL